MKTNVYRTLKMRRSRPSPDPRADGAVARSRPSGAQARGPSPFTAGVELDFCAQSHPVVVGEA